MRRVVRLNERDLSRIVKRVIREMEDETMDYEEDMMMDGEMEEGLFGPSKSKLAELKNEFDDKVRAKLEFVSMKRGEEYTMDDLANPRKFMSDAKDSNYKGEIKADLIRNPDNPDKPKLIFRWVPELTMMQKFAAGSRGQTLGT